MEIFSRDIPSQINESDYTGQASEIHRQVNKVKGRSEYNLLGLANYFDGIGLAIQNNKNSLKFNHTQKKCYKCKTGQCLG
jgi:hypothetical protein